MCYLYVYIYIYIMLMRVIWIHIHLSAPFLGRLHQLTAEMQRSQEIKALPEASPGRDLVR